MIALKRHFKATPYTLKAFLEQMQVNMKVKSCDGFHSILPALFVKFYSPIQEAFLQ